MWRHEWRCSGPLDLIYKQCKMTPMSVICVALKENIAAQWVFKKRTECPSHHFGRGRRSSSALAASALLACPLVPLGGPTASDSDHTSSTEGSEREATMRMRLVGSDSHPTTASALLCRQSDKAARSISARPISANRESVFSSSFMISGGSPRSNMTLHRGEGASPSCS